ncbi:adenosylcobinamide kinase [Billgrantia diversa]|uniref:bifunctional adenosylcobinamide kinase/adenosylcobinamide-phosphate guanylyltransferase n=1 Tax=Halomonas sp. MCCC 1A13316 TaxID=2733487 RepID=UPI0018A62E63|nr:bifunctional adenosylcobinamide kinase/adenosylcobinamide-phosphate guanylyltransferase [Halomonas sp. MCCC 1A13316]QOR39474.1 adenosylcobinamide kinase [Halomonas sp. MCCC 1A13316]
MQLFIGGTCAGKRSIVRQRFDTAVWHSAYIGCALKKWPSSAASTRCLVMEGWEHWLAARLADEPDDDGLRQAMAIELDALHAWEARSGGEVVLVMLEMGRGIVPLSAEKRRLRDLNGWLAQDAAARCERVWYVWNGLLKQLSY